MGVRFKVGNRSADARRVLQQVTQELENLRGRADIETYVSWVTRSDVVLRSVFSEPNLRECLYSDRFWHLFATPDTDQVKRSRRLNEALYAEIELQVVLFQELAVELGDIEQLAEPAGNLLVYDTNSLMHYGAPDDIAWSTIIDPPIRLIVPLIVIDELDGKRYSGSPKMSRRARGAQIALHRLLGDSGPRRSALPNRNGVTIEVLLDEPGHVRLPRPDDEILDRSRFLEQIAMRSVSIITQDLGMALRATSLGLEVLRIPETYRKPDDSE